MRSKTPVITSLSDVPEGYTELHRFATRPDGSQDRTLHKALVVAHNAGEIPAVKYFRTAGDWKSGPVYLDQKEATKFVAAWRAERQPKAAKAKAEKEPAPSGDDDLVRMLVASNRELVISVESLTKTIDGLADLAKSIASLDESLRNLQAAVELRSESITV